MMFDKMEHRKPNTDLYNVPFTMTEGPDGTPYRRLGNSGLKASSVGLGAWKFGYPETNDESRTDEATSLNILDRALELGVTFWDTANRYHNASGNSERIIGTWFSHNADRRRDVVLATKVAGGMDGRTPNHGGLSRTNILESVYACLERLQTDHIDLLYFHCADDTTPIDESLTAVDDLIREDMVRYFGVSTFTVAGLKQYGECIDTIGPRCRIVAVQNKFDMLNGESPGESNVLAYAADAGISMVPYSPLAGGLLTDRYLEPEKAKAGDRLVDEKVLDKVATPEVLARLRKLATLAEEWEMELSQLALAYTLSLPGMGPVIPSPSTVGQLETNATAAKIALSDEQKSRVAEIGAG